MNDNSFKFFEIIFETKQKKKIIIHKKFRTTQVQFVSSSEPDSAVSSAAENAQSPSNEYDRITSKLMKPSYFCEIIVQS